MEALRITGLRTLAALLLALGSRSAPAAAQSEDAGTPALAGDAAVAPKAETAAQPAAVPTPLLDQDVEDDPIAIEPGVEPLAKVASAPVPESETEPVSVPSDKIIYVLERIQIRGNTTRAALIRRFVPLAPGDALDVDDPAIENIRFRLMGTGWFNDVHLKLAKGSERGRVVLVIEVKERNTLVISQVYAGLARVVTGSQDRSDTLRPYAGLGVTEANLFGLGIGVGASAVVSEAQYGLDLRYRDPMRIGAGFDLNGRFFYNHAREFFGREPLVAINCPAIDPADKNPDPCDPDVDARRAVVIYNRVGVGLGTGHDITAALRYELDWLGELVDVTARPRAASTLIGEHGEERAPIDFHVDDGISRVSSLHLGLVFDRRDDPALPSRGQLLRLDARMGSGLFGSTYDFARFELAARHYQRLPWKHVLSLGAYVGTLFGRAPFFYRFYAADLSDLLPSRALELNLDHRRTHNLLGTSIKEFDKEDLAARVDIEYVLPLHRGVGGFRGIDAYAGVGLFFLADRETMRLGAPGYTGFERLPVDLTFDIGVQADTALGVFKVGFSSLIGFLPDLAGDTR